MALPIASLGLMAIDPDFGNGVKYESAIVRLQ
jgi:hypothetical protein